MHTWRQIVNYDLVCYHLDSTKSSLQFIFVACTVNRLKMGSILLLTLCVLASMLHTINCAEGKTLKT